MDSEKAGARSGNGALARPRGGRVGGSSVGPDHGAGQFTLQAGRTYEIEPINVGREEHEFLIGRGGLAGGAGEEHGFQESFFDGIDVSVEFEGGEVGTSDWKKWKSSPAER